MPGFTKGSYITPVGRNQFLRSTQDIKTESYTVARETIPSRTIDGYAGQQILQPGTVLAKITSGPNTGKVGPFQAAGTAEVNTITPSGTWSGGTYTLTVLGATTAPIAYNATTSAAQTAVNAALLAAGLTDTVAVTGAALSAGAMIITFVAPASGVSSNVTNVTINTASVTGSTPAASVAQTTAGVAGATDGRQLTTNIVGLCNTYLPWQLIERDVEVAVIYEAAVIQSKCIELDTAGNEIAMQNATATAMVAQKGMNLLFK